MDYTLDEAMVMGATIKDLMEWFGVEEDEWEEEEE